MFKRLRISFTIITIQIPLRFLVHTSITTHVSDLLLEIELFLEFQRPYGSLWGPAKHEYNMQWMPHLTILWCLCFSKTRFTDMKLALASHRTSPLLFHNYLLVKVSIYNERANRTTINIVINLLLVFPIKPILTQTWSRYGPRTRFGLLLMFCSFLSI